MEEQLTIQVHAYADLSPEEHEAADALSGDASLEDPRFAGFEWAEADWLVVGRLGDLIVCTVKIALRDVIVGGQRVRVGGIGDVATMAEWRRRGFAAAAMTTVGEFLCNDLGADFGLLFCDTHLLHYYSRFGWQRVDGPTMVEVPWGKVPFPEETMVLPCRQKEWPGGSVDRNGLPW